MSIRVNDQFSIMYNVYTRPTCISVIMPLV